MKRKITILLALTLAVGAFELARETFSTRTVTSTSWMASPVGRLDTAMWRSLAELAGTIYGLPAARFEEHARLRAEAMRLRDEKGATITEADWIVIDGMLERSWVSLAAAVRR